jgi:hypothetical protein
MAKQPKFKDTLPSELNENFGSNYMMDGFDYDMEYGHGLKMNPGADPVPQPPTTGMSQLPEDIIATMGLMDIEVPEGVLQEIEGAMDLEELEIITASVNVDVDRSDVGIVDYSWLSDAYQDPNRLPDKPVDNGLPELQEAWGDRSDGLNRIDLRDRSAITYEDARQGPEDDDPLNTDKLASLIRLSMRKSASGVSMGKIKSMLIEQLGPQTAKKAAKAVHAIGLEHGLVGNVYVRASAYPGLHRGKWTKQLKKASNTARYLVADPNQDCEAAAGVLGLRVVSHPTQIDWNDAYDSYSPRLVMTGRLDRTATVLDKREALRRAFLRDENAPRMDIETTKVTHTMPVDTVTASDAKQALVTFKPRQQQVITLQRRWKKAEVEKVVAKVGSLVEARLLTQEQAEKLLGSKAPPKQILRTAALLAINVRRGSYSGGEPVLAKVKVTSKEAWSELRTAEEKVSEQEASLQERIQYDKIEQKVAYINRHVQGGLKGKKLGALIRETLTKEEAVMASPLLTPILAKTSALNPKAPKTKEYEGKEYVRHVQASVDIEVPKREINKAARWIRQTMNEGFAGKDLDDLVHVRIDPKVLKAGSEKLTRIRSKHEGLAGHLYVDAAAYASKTGAEGCEAGGLKHRSNGLKYVLAMDRCAGCVFKNADGVCQKYNKVIVDDIPEENAEALRRKMLASHEASDQELTGALFSLNDVMSAVVPEDEFSLHNGALDELETDDPDATMLDGIFFGGFEV